MELPDFSVLPSYFPVHSSVRVNTDFTHVALLSQIDERLQTTKKNTEDFLAFISDHSHLLHNPQTNQYLDNQLRVYAELTNSKYRLQQLQSTLKTAHRGFVESRRHEHDLSLDNYNEYLAVDKTNFADDIVQQLEVQTDYGPILAADASYQYVKNARFVLEHPEDPLPDENKEDEVMVAGGKISLKDPLSLNYFVHPVISRKCGHVYEKEHIASALQSTIHCPVTGCTAQLGKNDLRDDKLMALRVKVYLAQEKKRPRAVRV